MADLPTGTVTLLFTDIAGSTRLLEQLGEGSVQLAIRRCRQPQPQHAQMLPTDRHREVRHHPGRGDGAGREPLAYERPAGHTAGNRDAGPAGPFQEEPLAPDEVGDDEDVDEQGGGAVDRAPRATLHRPSPAPEPG